MSDLEFVTRDLASGRIRPDQVEKHLDKWMAKLINHAKEQSAPGGKLLDFMQQLLG